MTSGDCSEGKGEGVEGVTKSGSRLGIQMSHRYNNVVILAWVACLGIYLLL